MNNKIIKYSLLILLFLGCKKSEPHSKIARQLNLKSNIDNTGFVKRDTVSNKVSKVKLNQELNQIIPDTTINNKLFLANYETLPRFYLDYKNIFTIDRIRESPVVVFCDKSKTEYLITYQYEGSTKNSFDCFEIGYLNNDKTLNKINLFNTEEVEFKTESNIGLGITLKELVAKKGSKYQIKNNEKEVILIYRNTYYKNSSFLKRYNMPSYFMEFILKDDKVIKIKFGFDYP